MKTEITHSQWGQYQGKRLIIRTRHDKDKKAWESQDEVRLWFNELFGEYLFWDHSGSDADAHYHFWLPRTKEQAMLLKLTYGG